MLYAIPDLLPHTGYSHKDGRTHFLQSGKEAGAGRGQGGGRRGRDEGGVREGRGRGNGRKGEGGELC